MISQKDCWHITNEKTTLFCEDNRLKGWSIGPKMCIVGAQLQSNLFPIRILNNAQEHKIVESICVVVSTNPSFNFLTNEMDNNLFLLTSFSVIKLDGV